MPLGSPDWLTSILSSGITREAVGLVISLAILVVVERRLAAIDRHVCDLIQSTSETLTTVQVTATHNTSRMQEIRDAIVRLERNFGRMIGR